MVTSSQHDPLRDWDEVTISASPCRCQNRDMSENAWALVEQERLALADFLETLTEAEWSTPSLCAEWSIQEVAAHITWANTVPLGDLLSALARDGFRANRTSVRLAREWSRRGPDAILAQLRSTESSTHLTPGTRPRDVLADTLCHHIDMRVPLGRVRPAPPEATRLALTVYSRMGFPLHLAFGRNPKSTAKGLHLVADDVGWSAGAGPDVHGSSSALIRALTGRPVGDDELTGKGAVELYARLA